MYHLLIVEDSRFTRQSLERMFGEMDGYLVIASIENAANAEILCMRRRIDLILMDVCTADNESGLNAAAKIKKYYPDIKIIIMTSMPEHSFIEKAKEAGCDSFWYKEDGDSDIVEICGRTMKGESVWPDETPVLKIGMALSTEFTARELDVIRALTMGSRYEKIAEDLSMSVNTVKYHVRNILQKTGFQNTTKLVSEVVEKRFVLPTY